MAEAGFTGPFGGESEQFVDADAEHAGEVDEQVGGWVSGLGLEVGDDAAAGADLVGELLLGEACGLAQGGEARPEPFGGGGGVLGHVERVTGGAARKSKPGSRAWRLYEPRRSDAMHEDRTLCRSPQQAEKSDGRGLTAFGGGTAMARFPDHEIERLKQRVSVVRLVESAGGH